MSYLQTGFLSGPNGSLHVSLFLPAPGSLSHAWVVHVPAFAEEMNKSRAMVARQARALAARGVAVLVPDLSGTGDSSGSLETSTWCNWLDDITFASLWVREQGASHLTLWGNRLGCLLALESAVILPTPPDQLLFWQPVHSGKQYMAQFLRLRMAAGLTSGDTETVAALRNELLEKDLLEVAGYTLSSELFREIESRALMELSVPRQSKVMILEITGEHAKPLLPVTAKLVKQWSDAGIDCHAQVVTGDLFWMTQELGLAPLLIDQTVTGYLAISEQDPAMSYTPQALGQTALIPAGLAPDSQDSSRSIVFLCETEQLVGIIHRAAAKSSLGVLVVVGGPQYRVGSHRQFAHLAQFLAAEGIPAMIFDYRGMGDSSGVLQGFKHIDPDIHAAVDTLLSNVPGLSDVVIWGLCDAATAAMAYAPGDARVKGLILANPWVFSPVGVAKAYLRHYYIQRIFQEEFWRKLGSGKFDIVTSLRSMLDLAKTVLVKHREHSILFGSRPGKEFTSETSNSVAILQEAGPNDLVMHFFKSLMRFRGGVSFIFSGNDLTAAEFLGAVSKDRKLKKVMNTSQVRQVRLPGVDHTFSKKEWRETVESISVEEIRRIRYFN